MTYRAWNTKEVDRAALKELTAAIVHALVFQLFGVLLGDGGGQLL